MGRRARNKGLANVALRAASRAVNERDLEASRLANMVYQEILEWRQVTGLAVFGVIGTAAKLIAVPSAEKAGIPATKENLEDIVHLFIKRFLDLADNLTLEDLEASRVDARERFRAYTAE
jgi:hypothetical protein